MRYSYSYTGICPYCQLNVNFTPIMLEVRRQRYRGHDSAVRSIDYSEKKKLYLDQIDLSDRKAYPTNVNIVTCDHCMKTLSIFFVFEKLSKDEGEYKIRFTYPIISRAKMPDGVPQNIWYDYVEAMICLNSNAPKGAVVLLRRATQSLMKELGADPTKKLWKQIEEVKNDGKITEELYQIATELRHWGNFGAHPDDDMLEDVTIDEANEMKNIFYMLLDYTVIQKAKVKQIQDRRIKKKSEKK